MHTLVRAIGILAHTVLDGASDFHTSLHVLALYELEDDIALRRLGVEPLVSLLIPFLHRDNRVLSHSHIEVVLGTVHTQRVGLEATCYLTGRQGIGMHGDEQVGIRLVGDIGTIMQWDEDIRGTSIDHPHVWHIALHISSESQSYVQIDVLLLRLGAQGSSVMPTMTGVDDKCKTLIGSIHTCRQE